MPEPGPFQLCAVLKRHGFRAYCRDLNIELYHEWFRKEANLRFVDDFLSNGGFCPSSPEAYMERLQDASFALGLGRLKPSETLSEHLFLERRYDNPLKYHGCAFSSREKEPDHGLQALSIKDPDWFSDFVEACHYLLFRPRSTHIDEAIKFARMGSPVLDRFYDDFVDELVTSPPDFVGISIWNTDALAPAMRLSYKIRQRLPDMPIIAGNAWCSTALSLFPTIPEIFDFFDAAVVGYADKVIVELVKRVIRRESLEGLPNVVFRKDGLVVMPERIEQVRLQEMLPPDFSGLRLDLYPDRRIGIRVYNGCPWGRCLFCHHVLQGITVVQGDPDLGYIEEALDYCAFLVRKHSIARFYLGDHGLPWRFLVAFCEGVLRRNLKIRFEAMGRFDKDMSLETAKLVRSAGCTGLYVGVETTHEDVLRRMRKGFTLSVVERALEILSKAGLKVCCFLMVFPWTREEDFQKDINWVLQRKAQIAYITAQIFELSRGTEAFLHPQVMGVNVASNISRDTDVWKVPYTPTPQVTEKQVKEVQRRVNEELLEAQGKRNLVLVDFTLGANDKNTDPDHGLLSIFSMLLCSLPENSRQLAIHTVRRSGGTFMDEEKVSKEILSFSPDIVALSVKEQSLKTAKDVARRIKEQNERCLVVAGGQAVAPPFDRFSSREFDCLVCGNGELAFSEIVGHYFLSGGERESLSGIPNVALPGALGWRLQSTLPINLNTIPSPLNLRLLQNPENLFIAVSRRCIRGCPSCECARRVTRFSAERLALEILNAGEIKAHKVCLVTGAKRDLDQDIKVIYRALSTVFSRQKGIPEHIGIWLQGASDSELIRDMAKKGYVKELVVEIGAVRETRKPEERSKHERIASFLSSLSSMINVSVTLLLGAPGYGAEDFRYSVDFFDRYGIPINMRLLRRTPALARSRDFIFAPEPWVHLEESRAVSNEDLRSCANYFIRKARRKGALSDFTTLMPEDVPFSSWISTDAILEAHENFKEALPEKLKGLATCLEHGFWRKVVQALGMETGFVRLKAGDLRFDGFSSEQITLTLVHKDGNTTRIWIALLKQDRKVWKRTKSVDIWYESKPSVTFEHLKPVLEYIASKLQKV